MHRFLKDDEGQEGGLFIGIAQEKATRWLIPSGSGTYTFQGDKRTLALRPGKLRSPDDFPSEIT